MDASFQNAGMQSIESKIRVRPSCIDFWCLRIAFSKCDVFSRCKTLLLFLVTAVSVLGLSGCQGTKKEMRSQLIERELRFQEDEIYDLTFQLEDSQRVVETYRNEIEELKKQIEEAQNGVSLPAPPAVRKIFPKSDSPENLDFELEAPKVNTSSTSSKPASTSSNRIENDLPLEKPLAPTPATEELPPPNTATSAGPVSSVEITRRIATNLSPAPHGFTIQAVITPVNSNGKTIKHTGVVSLMIIDPKLEESANRLVRWDFKASDTSKRWKQTSLGSGLHFDVPLPVDLSDGAYELWVRFTTQNGKQHLASIDLQLDRQAIADRELESSPKYSSIPDRNHLAMPYSKPSVRTSSLEPNNLIAGNVAASKQEDKEIVSASGSFAPNEKSVLKKSSEELSPISAETRIEEKTPTVQPSGWSPFRG